MSRCEICHRDGLLFVEHADPDGYVVLACKCPLGARWETKHQLRAFCARLNPPPLWFGRIDDFFTPAELKATTAVEREHQVVDGIEHPAIQQPESSHA